MARFALRNQERIKKAFGEEKLNELLKELKVFFTLMSKNSLFGCTNREDKPYPSINIHGVAEVYITDIKFDVFHLALKAFL